MAAFQHASRLAGHRVEALPVREARILLDLKQRPFRRPPEHGKDRPIFQKIQRVIPPFSSRHHPSVERHQFPHFVAVKRDLRRRGGARLAHLCRFERHDQRLVGGSGILCHGFNQLRKSMTRVSQIRRRASLCLRLLFVLSQFICARSKCHDFAAYWSHPRPSPAREENSSGERPA